MLISLIKRSFLLNGRICNKLVHVDAGAQISGNLPSMLKVKPKKYRSQPTNLKREIDDIQAKYPSHILLIQVGMFYEIYDCNGYLEEIAELLGLRIANHQKGIDNENRYTKFAGFPMHQLKTYVNILIKKGKTVGIVDQFVPDQNTGIIRRKITRILTPGTLLEEDFDGIESQNNFLLSIHAEPGSSKVGLSWIDVTTGEFFVSITSTAQLTNEVTMIQPKEIIASPGTMSIKNIAELLHNYDCLVTIRPMGEFLHSDTDVDIHSILNDREKIESLSDVDKNAASALLRYLKENFPMMAPFLRTPSKSTTNEIMKIDLNTFQSLEIYQTLKDKSKKGSLLSVLKVAKTAGGKRLLRSRLRAPSTNLSGINRKHSLISIFYENPLFAEVLSKKIQCFRDIERILQRIQASKTNAGELALFFHCLKLAVDGKKLLVDFGNEYGQNRFLTEIATILGFSEVDLLPKYSNIFSSGQGTFDSSLVPVGSITHGYSSTLDKLQGLHRELTKKVEQRSNDLQKLFGCINLNRSQVRSWI